MHVGVEEANAGINRNLLQAWGAVTNYIKIPPRNNRRELEVSCESANCSASDCVS